MSESPYEWVNLTRSTLNFVHEITGKSKKELKEILDAKEKEGVHKVKIPLGPAIFSRETIGE